METASNAAASPETWASGLLMRFHIECYSIPIDHYDMVLSVTFLRTLGPILWDFNDLCMAFWREGHSVFWRSIGSTRHDVQSTRRMNSIRHNEPELLDRLL